MRTLNLKEVWLCVCMISLFSFQLIAQQLSESELMQHEQFLQSENYDYYIEKLGFEEMPGLQLTGNINLDKQNYKLLVENKKLKTHVKSENLVTREGEPANDLCENAIYLECGDTVSGSTTGSTYDNAGTCGTSNTTGGVWYSVVPPEDAFYTFSTCNTANYDTKITVYTGGCVNLDCVGGQDDFSGCSGFTTNLTVHLIANTQYLVLVHGFASSTGDFDLTVTCEDEDANNDACNATSLNVNELYPYSVTLASVQSGEPSPGAGSGFSSCNSQDGWCSFETSVQNSVWFTFEAPQSGRVTIVASDYDNQLALWSTPDCADFSSYTEIAANDDSGDDVWPGIHVFSAAIIDACVTPGEIYYIQLDGFGGNTGSGDISVIDAGSTSEIDVGDDATVYFGYDPLACTTLTATVSDADGTDDSSIVWSTGETGASINVCPETTTTYTACYNDPNGCTSCDMLTVCAVDVRCFTPGGVQKVEICHKPGSNKEKTLCIDESSIAAHLAHGDVLGSCGTSSPCDAIESFGSDEEEINNRNADVYESNFNMYPNPAFNEIVISITLESNETALLKIFDQSSKLIIQKEIDNGQTAIDLDDNLNGLYFVELSSASFRKIQKLIIQ